MIERGVNAPMEPCVVCGEPEPRFKYHAFPWHITCAYDDAGQRKIAAWRREQKKIAKSEVPRLV